jgi:hypothetical protein
LKRIINQVGGVIVVGHNKRKGLRLRVVKNLDDTFNCEYCVLKKTECYRIILKDNPCRKIDPSGHSFFLKYYEGRTKRRGSVDNPK